MDKVYRVTALEDNKVISELDVQGVSRSDVLEYLIELGEFNDYPVDSDKVAHCKTVAGLNRLLPANVKYKIERVSQ